MVLDTQWYQETRSALLRPAASWPPCGPNLEYDQLYMELFTKLVPKEIKIVRQVSGKPTLDAKFEPVPWLEVERDCLSLLERSRDVRLLIVLMRCRVRKDQGYALAWGLRLLADTLELWPEAVHPALQQEGEDEAQARAAALSDLQAQDGLLAEIRRIQLFPLGGERREVRHVEQSFTLPRPKEADPPEQVRQSLAQLRERGDANLASLLEALELVRQLDLDISKKLAGADFSLTALAALLACLAPPAAAYEEASEAGDGPRPEALEAGGARDDQDEPPKPAVKPPRGTGRQPRAAAPASSAEPALVRAANIPDRDFARRQISEVRQWFEKHEPSSPLALLLTQAEGLVGKRFSELVSFLPREILEQWEKKE